MLLTSRNESASSSASILSRTVNLPPSLCRFTRSAPPSSCASCWRRRSSSSSASQLIAVALYHPRKSFGLDARRLDHFRPFRQLRAHQVAEFLRRAGRRIEALSLHDRLGVQVREPLLHELVEPGDDGGWRAAGARQRVSPPGLLGPHRPSRAPAPLRRPS